MLNFNSISLRRGVKVLFEDARFQIHPGQRVGVTGANGTGKTSLFALILGELHTDAGDLQIPAEWIIAHVAQEMAAEDKPAIEYILDGDTELREIQMQLEEADANDEGTRSATLYGKLDHIGGYHANSRAGRLMHGLGFQTSDENKPVNTFSGGWRMRLNLARALMCRSDLLLLDEPTNHLDLDAIVWLEQWLKDYPGTLLLVSHDRDFLDGVSTHIAHIEHGGLQLYTGNYSAFEVVRAERLANQQAAHIKQKAEVAHIRSYVERFRAKATKAKQAQSRLKALERMELIAPAHVDSPFHFAFLKPDKLPTTLMTLDQVSTGYDGTAIISGINRSVLPGDRIGLLGPNGAGKSTFIKLLARELIPQSGQIETARDLNIGYFAQHQIEQLNSEQSPLEHLIQLDPQAKQQSLRDFLGGFGFNGDKALEKVAPFSGGEKSRLVLALTVYQRPNLLLLDEPTNHLDIEMRQALATALQEFEGAMVIVSHDRHLLRVTTDSLLVVLHGQVSPFDDALDDYPGWLAQELETGSKTPTKSTESHSASAKKDRKREAAERRKKLQPLSQKLKKLDKLLASLQSKQSDLETQLTDASIYEDKNKTNLKLLLINKASTDTELESTEEEWLALSEEIESYS